MKIAVIGSGISGLSAAWLLSRDKAHQVTVYEKEDYIGGHTHTIDIESPKGSNRQTSVDTGFIVFNTLTYPNLVNLFKQLGVQYQDSNMSFAVSKNEGYLEWAGESLGTVFAQKSNLLNLKFWMMLIDMVRFNSQAPKVLTSKDPSDATITLGQYLEKNKYSEAFTTYYLLPMAAAVWSTPPKQMLDFPLLTFVQFYHNHRFLQIFDRPTWLTVNKGSREYIKKILPFIESVRTNCGVTRVRRENGQVEVTDSTGSSQSYDHVIFACHGDQILPLLDASPDEQAILQGFRYKKNRTVVHRDASLMPKLRKTWSSWNYLINDSTGGGTTDVCVTYWMNRLQPFLGSEDDIFITLNPIKPIDPSTIIREFMYEHPVYDSEVTESQKKLDGIQGLNNTWYAGAWTGFGFHEDGLTSGLTVGLKLGAQSPFTIRDLRARL